MDWNFLGGEGSLRTQHLQKCINLNWNFQMRWARGGGGVFKKIPSVGSYGHILELRNLLRICIESTGIFSLLLLQLTMSTCLRRLSKYYLLYKVYWMLSIWPKIVVFSVGNQMEQFSPTGRFPGTMDHL